jgi:hypothetical protein
MNIKIKAICVMFLLPFFFHSCEKPEGIGGNASIKGKVITHTYDSKFRNLQWASPASEARVYISSANSDFYFDETRTFSDGTFKFDFLTKGKFIITVYSENDSISGLSGKKSVETEITLLSSREEKSIDDIAIYQTVDFDEGHATIKGRIRQVNFAKDFAFIKDTTLAQDEDVYLIYEDDEFYSERLRTLYDGTFVFPNLIKGNYLIIFYADDVNGGIEKMPVKVPATINETYQTVDVGDYFVEKED